MRNFSLERDRGNGSSGIRTWGWYFSSRFLLPSLKIWFLTLFPRVIPRQLTWSWMLQREGISQASCSSSVLFQRRVLCSRKKMGLSQYLMEISERAWPELISPIMGPVPFLLQYAESVDSQSLKRTNMFLWLPGTASSRAMSEHMVGYHAEKPISFVVKEVRRRLSQQTRQGELHPLV